MRGKWVYFCEVKKNNSMSYEAAFQELQQILAEIQEGVVSIDQLALRVERANELVQFCRERLRQTEASIQQLNFPTNNP